MRLMVPSGRGSQVPGGSFARFVEYLQPYPGDGGGSEAFGGHRYHDFQRRQGAQVLFEPGKKHRVANQADLDDLGESGRELAVGKRIERVGVDNHRARLMERADHVLAERVVHAGLAADRGVHLGEQRGRHLDERDAALVTGGGESGHVADNTPAQRNEGGAPVTMRRKQRIENTVQHLERFVLLAIGQHHLDWLQGNDMCAQPGEIQRRHRLVGDNGHPGSQDMPREQFGPVEQAGADIDRVTSVPKIKRQRFHRFARLPVYGRSRAPRSPANGAMSRPRYPLSAGI